MNNRSNRKLTMIVSSVLAAAAAPGALAQGTDRNLENIIVTGTRVADRSVAETAVPVDVVSAEALNNVGVTELNQALATALPSFNFPRPGLADGTDTIRPATLRGLAPDQTLVLLNSKRRHASSLVNGNGTIGRGSSAVDHPGSPSNSLPLNSMTIASSHASCGDSSNSAANSPSRAS